MRPVCGGVRDARGTTLIEVMITIALLGVGLYFFLQALYEVSSAQREVQHRLTAVAAAEQIAEAVMAYTGSNECLYNLYHNPPDVEITDQDTDVAKMTDDHIAFTQAHYTAVSARAQALYYLENNPSADGYDSGLLDLQSTSCVLVGQYKYNITDLGAAGPVVFDITAAADNQQFEVWNNDGSGGFSQAPDSPHSASARVWALTAVPRPLGGNRLKRIEIEAYYPAKALYDENSKQMPRAKWESVAYVKQEGGSFTLRSEWRR